MQDIKPKRSIRNITLPGNRRTSTRSTSREESGTLPKKQSMPNRKGNKKFFIGGGIILLLLAIFALMTIFGSTTVTVTPKTANATINTTLAASPISAQSASSTILYENINLEKIESKDVPATDERYVEEKAQGTIIVYNDFDENPQRLITNTRFETPEGLIYRIRESVVVPGQKTEGGKTIPGSIEVTVYADEAGDTYNIGLTDFTIPGFKDDPRFDKFYARSKTDMNGGFVGNKKQVAEGIKNETVRELDNTLRASLLQELQAQIPTNLVILEDLVSFSIEDQPQVANGDMVTISRKGTITAPLFDAESLAHELAGQNGVPNDIPLYLQSYNALTISTDDTENSDILEFSISGNASFIGVIDEEEIRNALVGQNKGDLGNILANFPGIAEAHAKISPFWISTFPDTGEDIAIIIDTPTRTE